MKKLHELSYAAGIIDGEGCITLYFRNKTMPNHRLIILLVDVINTSEWLIQWLKFHFGGSVIAIPSKGNCKPCWHWRLQSQQACEFLKLIADKATTGRISNYIPREKATEK
jgi:hypothetical protein